MILALTLLGGCSPEPAGGELYRRFADRQGLTVAEVVDFELEKGVSVDVVMLCADNDTLWQQLKAEFDIRGEEGTVSWLGDTRNPSVRTEWKGEPVLRVVASHARRTVGFYRIENETQYDALIDYQLRSKN